MLFNSVQFAIFLPIVVMLYWGVASKYQWLVILIASCVFYMSWNPKYIILIACTVVSTYLCARLIEKNQKHRKFFLALSILICLGLLVYFKYFNLLIDTIHTIFHNNNFDYGKIVLPVGISFYTFQTMSYVIDVYCNRIKPEKNVGVYSAFVMFFPQLVAGPIERADHLLPQIRKEHEFDYEYAKYGLKLMAWGYFKKLVIADNLGRCVDIIYGNITDYRGLSLAVATVFFALQIYCDFSGYSDIAIGTANLFGIKIVSNFHAPYLSASLKEFWTRWHISLSTWFRDYVYIPLGGNRKGTFRKDLNLVITFLVSGLWHGANWTFAIWGLCHGIIQILENKMKSIKWIKCKTRAVMVLFTFVLVCICWVFFRADSFSDAMYVFKHSLDGITNLWDYIYRGYHDLQMTKRKLVKYTIAIIILFIYDYNSLKFDVIEKISSFSAKIRWIVYYTVVLFILFWGNFGSNQFVYFQF